MACCEHHDRLDQVLHVTEYVGMTCGSLKNVCVVTQGSYQATGEQKKHYCCFDCPTLKTDQKG